MPDLNRLIRRLSPLLFLLLAAALPATADELKPEQRNYDLEDLTLDLRVDLAAKKVIGSATWLFKPTADKFALLALHCEDTIVFAAFVGERGKPEPARRIRLDGGVLRIDLAREFPKDAPLEARIEYEATPKRGLYFFSPTPEHPETPSQVWSQGEGQDNRHWFPCYDEPDDRFKVTQRIRVPEGYQVVANGVLAETKTEETPAPAAPAPAGAAPAQDAKPAPPLRETVFTFRFDQNLVAYLVSLIVGKFDVVEETWEGVPLRYYVPPGRKSAIRLAFGLTPEMMKFFSAYTGCKYPYTSYAQTTVWDFIYGGMENSSVTTLNQRALHAPRSHVDYQADGLVAHELAHSWFGDLLTCLDWQEMWLNEGFATYFADLWTEEHGGAEEFLLDRVDTADGYAAASTPELLARLRREPGKEKKPLELPEGMNYTKGSVVLHTLRHVMGDEKFREGIRRWVAQHRDAGVTSEEFRASLEEVYGDNLGWFFDQWVYGAGVPEFSVDYEWHEAVRHAVVRVRQTQPISLGRDLYRLPVDLGFGFAVGERGVQVEIRRVWVDARQQEFEFDLPRAPEFVSFDVGARIAKRLDFARPPAMLEAQLLRDSDVTGRYAAARRLGREGKAARAALERALKDEANYRVRARIVEALAEADAEGAAPALVEAAKDVRAEVRKAAAAALGKLAAEKAQPTLAALAESDASDEVREAALRGLAACKAPGAGEIYRRALRWPSYREAVRGAAIEGLAKSGDVAAIPELLPFVTGTWEAGSMHRVKALAMDQLAGLAPKDPRVVEAVLQAFGDPYFRTRSAAARALGRMQPSAAAGKLLERLETETDPGVKDAIRAALKELVGGGGAGTASAAGTAKTAEELEAEAAALEADAAALALDGEMKKLEAQKLRLRAKALRDKAGGGGKKKDADKK
ncbi:MAG: HEAT repeat domain-containing protein [Planctomycetes bacterium]|nr:HEAT repeat domain-containing protein [Planctomycetota bacterium]